MKKMLVIMLAVIMALGTAACGTAQPTTQTTPAVEVKPEVTPAPEVSESEPAEAPKEEPEATEVVEETPEVTEEVAEEKHELTDDEIFALMMEPAPDVIDGIDFTAYKENQKDFFEVVDEQAKYEDCKIFVKSAKGAEAILSNGDSYTEMLPDYQYTYWYYAPKDVSSIELVGNGEFFDKNEISAPDYSKFVGASSINHKEAGESKENIPLEVKISYADGSEESVIIYVTLGY